MPSKRTSDSVDRILQELDYQQTAAQVRGSVTDQQVESILRSVSAGSAGQGTGHEQGLSGFAFAELEEAPRYMPPARPAARPYARPTPPTAQPEVRQTAPQARHAMRPVAQERRAEVLADTGTIADTTRTDIIKNFLTKMAPGEKDVDTDALNQVKGQFVDYFKESVAVVPDEKGRIREPRGKKRGPFGLKSAEDNQEFLPINYTLRTRSEDEPEEREEPAEESGYAETIQSPPTTARSAEYYPDREEAAPLPEPTPRPRKKGGLLGDLFGGLFGGAHSSRRKRNAEEEIYIPEGRVTPEPRPAPQPGPSLGENAPTQMTQPPRHSKYTHRTQPAARENTTLSGDTLQALRGVVNAARPTPPETAPTGQTIYRKKRNTVEFVPGQKAATLPASPQTPSGEPVGDRYEPDPAPASGFTMQMGALDVLPMDSTQDFMQAYDAVRRPRRADPAAPPAAPRQPVARQQTATPRQPVAPQQTAAPRQAVAPQQTVVSRGYTMREPDDVDYLVDTLTGKIKLTDLPPVAPQKKQQAQHSGFTVDLGGLPATPPSVPFVVPPTDNRPPVVEPITSTFAKNIADAINADNVAPQSVPLRPEAAFDTAARRLTDFGQDAGQRKTTGREKGKAGFRNFHLGGIPADEIGNTGTLAGGPFETAELPVTALRHDYASAEDAPAVRRELQTALLHQRLSVLLTGVTAVVVLILTISAMLSTAEPGPLGEGSVLLGVVLVLLLVGCAAGWRTLFAGALGLAGPATPDTLAMLPAVGALVQLVVLLAMPQSYQPTTLPLLAGPALLVLCFNRIGHLVDAMTVENNFRLVSAPVDHAVAYRLKDAGALGAVSRGLAEPHACVLVSRPTQIFKNFLSASAAPGTSDKNLQQFAWIVGGFGLAGLVFSLITTKNAAMAATVMACIVCLATPLASSLLSALPARLMQRSAAQVGAVVPGWRDICQLGRINMVQVSSRDLFPAGCVSLSGIKPVKPEHIDTAIVYAASLLAEAPSPLRDIFVTMLGQNKNLLAKVADRQMIYGKGCMGWINKRRVLVGNRQLMLDYGIKLPSLEYEQQHTVNQRRVIYLTVSGKLFAMFQVAYQRDNDTAGVLDELRHRGVSLIVDTEDFNCDVALLEAAYGLPTGSVKVLTAAEHETLKTHTAWLPESAGNLLHLGSFSSFVGGLEAAEGAAQGEQKASTVLTAGVFFSCVLAALLTLTGGLAGLPLPAIVLYQAVWAVLALIFPLLQRY